jgi:hypothetical protein
MTRQDPLRWSVRVASDDQRGAVVYARTNRFEVGAPISFDAQAVRSSALEYLLGAIGADLVAGMKERCHRRRLEVDNVEAVVQGELDNALAYLGVVGEEGHTGLKELTIKVYVETLEEEEDIRVAWDEMLTRSPLYRTLAPVVHFNLELHIAV